MLKYACSEDVSNHSNTPKSSLKLNKYAKILDGRIAVSNPAKDFIHNFIPESYKIIPNAVDIEKFKTSNPLNRIELEWNVSR